MYDETLDPELKFYTNDDDRDFPFVVEIHNIIYTDIQYNIRDWKHENRNTRFRKWVSPDISNTYNKRTVYFASDEDRTLFTLAIR